MPNTAPDNVIRPPRHFWGRCRRRRHAARALGARQAAAFARRVEKRLDMTPPQAAAWARVTDILVDGTDALDRLGEDLDLLRGGLPAPVRLARLESALVTGLDLTHRLRPAFEAFYGTLTPAQKEVLDDLAEPRRRRHRH
jgi:hypothetical protein